MKKRILWVGDAGVSTGFARITHKVLDALVESGDWDAFVLGINYLGDPHPYAYPIFPCLGQLGGGTDMFGLARIQNISLITRPDVVVILNDPWNIPPYLKMIGTKFPVVGFLAVDGKNCRGEGLNGLTHAMFWTRFGEEQARLGGFTGQSSVVPLGVDLDVYHPIDRLTARQKIGIPSQYDNHFVVGRVDRNQPRKRWDLMLEYFAEWVKAYDVRDALLHAYIAPTGDLGWDLDQLMQYYFGREPRLILTQPELGHGHSEKVLAHVYSTFDVMLTTTQGEGWGLPIMEGMACGVPQVVPNWSALGEWCRDATAQIECKATAATPNFVNAIGGVLDKTHTIDVLQQLYTDSRWWTEYRRRGFELVNRDEYRWSNIAKRIDEILTRVIAGAPVQNEESEVVA